MANEYVDHVKNFAVAVPYSHQPPIGNVLTDGGAGELMGSRVGIVENQHINQYTAGNSIASKSIADIIEFYWACATTYTNQPIRSPRGLLNIHVLCRASTYYYGHFGHAIMMTVSLSLPLSDSLYSAYLKKKINKFLENRP